MLTLHAPTVLALLGTLLMAVVIFAPTASGAAPAAPAERYSPLPFEAFAPALAPRTAAEANAEPKLPGITARDPSWPAIVDPSAAECDAGARLALVDALAAVRSPWADAILRSALAEEPDERVRCAIATVLAV
jgi:hypothetical protein